MKKIKGNFLFAACLLITCGCGDQDEGNGRYVETPVELSEEHGGLAYKNLQRVILQMQKQGVLLGIVSKNNEADAMDIVQEGAYRAMLKADTLREERFAGTWVYRIMINEAKEYLRKNRRDVGELKENLEAPAQHYRDMDLEEAVGKLSEMERTLIILRFYEDKQLSEIAEILEENLSTVKSRLYRTLGKLRAELAKKR